MAQPAFISARPRFVTGLVCMAAVLAGLTGCAKIKNRTTVVVVDGYWHTPDGQIEFERTDGKEMSERFDISRNSSKAYWIAEYKKQGVVLNPLKLYSPLVLFGGHRAQIVMIGADQAFYEIRKPGEDAWGPKTNLSLPAKSEFKCITPEKACAVGFGAPFIANIIKAYPLEGYYIRYHIPYNTDGQEFLIDVVLEFKKDRHIGWSDWHFPGSP